MKSLGLLLLIITGLTLPVNSEEIPSQKKFDIYLQVKFKNKNVVLFSYLDSNYRNSTVKIVNNKEGDTILVRKITTDKPTVFTYSELINNLSYQQRFIAFSNDDTISFEMNNNKLCYIGYDKRNYIVNQIFGKTDFNYKRISIPDFTNQQIVIENERTKQINALTNLISLYSIDTFSIKTIRSLINLYYYDKLFNINFSGEDLKNWENPYFNKFDSLDKKNKILSSLSSPYSVSILYKLIRYGAYLNKSQNTDILENIQYLNPRYHKTKYLDGLILNEIDNQIKTYDERERVLAKLKYYMINTFEPFNYFKKPVGNEVYNTSFSSFTNKNVNFKDLLKVDQKIIVLDFWASWCTPCVAEIPMLKSHIKNLTDIKFISISLDKESAKWVEACNKYDIRSNSFRILDVSNNELLKYFGIRTIPRFIVMTNKGEILSDDFFRPSDTKFEVDLKKMMADYK